MGLPENRKLYESIPQEKKDPAIEFFRTRLSDEVKEQIRGAMRIDITSWFAVGHFTWGMSARNSLRDAGFCEGYFGIENLDDIYVEIIEDAVKE